MIKQKRAACKTKTGESSVKTTAGNNGKRAATHAKASTPDARAIKTGAIKAGAIKTGAIKVGSAGRLIQMPAQKSSIPVAAIRSAVQKAAGASSGVGANSNGKSNGASHSSQAAPRPRKLGAAKTKAAR